MPALPWYQIAADFSRNKKTLELASRLRDPNAGMYVVRLFEHCAEQALDGRISVHVVEDAAGWLPGRRRGAFIEHASAAGFLEKAPDTADVLILHGWEERNGSRIRKALADAKKPRGNKPRPPKNPPVVPRGTDAGPTRDGEGSRAGPSGVDVDGRSRGTAEATSLASSRARKAGPRAAGEDAGGAPPRSAPASEPAKSPEPPPAVSPPWPVLGRDGLAEGDIPQRRLTVVDAVDETPDPYPLTHRLAGELRNRVGPITAPPLSVVGNRQAREEPGAIARESERLEAAIVRAGYDQALLECVAATEERFRANQKRPDVLSWYTPRIERLPPVVEPAPDPAADAITEAEASCPDWARMLRRLAETVPLDAFRAHFADLRGVRRNGSLTLYAADGFHALRVRDLFLPQLTEIAQAVLGEAVRVDVQKEPAL